VLARQAARRGQRVAEAAAQHGLSRPSRMP